MKSDLWDLKILVPRFVESLPYGLGKYHKISVLPEDKQLERSMEETALPLLYHLVMWSERKSVERETMMFHIAVPQFRFIVTLKQAVLEVS